MLAQILAMALPLRLSVSVTSRCSIKRDGQIDLGLGIEVSTIIPCGSFSYTPDFKLCYGISIVETCYQLSWKKVDAHSEINWTVVGQLSDNISELRRSTVILSRGSISYYIEY